MEIVYFFEKRYGTLNKVVVVELGGKRLLIRKETRVLVISVLFFMFGSLLPVYKYMPRKDNHLNLEVGAAILIDADTGKVLYQYNADELLGVASMSTMMTEYLVLEAIHEGKISWDDEIVIDKLFIDYPVHL